METNPYVYMVLSQIFLFTIFQPEVNFIMIISPKYAGNAVVQNFHFIKIYLVKKLFIAFFTVVPQNKQDL